MFLRFRLLLMTCNFHPVTCEVCFFTHFHRMLLIEETEEEMNLHLKLQSFL